MAGAWPWMKAGMEVTKSKPRAGRGNARLQLLLCAKSLVVRPGETRGFPGRCVPAAAAVGVVRQVWVARDPSQNPPRLGCQGCLGFSEGLKAKLTRTRLCSRKGGSQRGHCGNPLFRHKTTDSTFADLLSPCAPSIFPNLSGCSQTAMTSF